MSTPRVYPTLLLAFLLGASILAVQPAGGYPVTAAQSSLVEGTFGDNAPFAQWTPQLMTSTFYLHSQPTGSLTGTDPLPASLAADVTGAYFDAVAPTRETSAPTTIVHGFLPDPEGEADYGNQALIGCKVYSNTGCQLPPGGAMEIAGGLDFVLGAGIAPRDRMQLYGFSTSVHAGCQKIGVGGLSGLNPALPVFGISSKLIRQVLDESGAWVADPTVGSAGNSNEGVIASTTMVPGLTSVVPGGVSLYSGTSTFGDRIAGTGPTLLVNQRLVVRYEVSSEIQGDVFCVLYYDGTYTGSSGPVYSRLSLVTDAQRVAVFPTDEDGGLATGFPAATSTDSLGRRLTVEALMTTAFAPQAEYVQQLLGKHAHVRLYSLDAQEFLYYRDNTAGGFPREFNTDTFRLVSSHAEDLTPAPDIETHLGSGVLRRSYVFAYGADQPNVNRIEPQFYSFDDDWEIKGTSFSIGGRGISFSLLSGETTTHLVNAGQATEFLFRVANTGTNDDVVTVSITEPGGGWTARVLGGGQYFLKPGGQAIGTVELVPPPSAVAGASRTVTLTASSGFDDVADPAPVSVRSEITNTVSRAVSLKLDETTLNVRPGVTKGFAATVQNKGTHADSFVLIPSFPTNVQGWNIRSNPASLQVPAGSIANIQILVTPPAEAPAATTFPLGLSAVAVGDGTIASRVDTTVNVFDVGGLLLNLVDPLTNRTMRGVGADCVGDITPLNCAVLGESFPDTDFDDSALFRVDVVNQASRPGRFKVEAFWDNSIPGELDDGTCEGFLNDPEGVPDGWRFNYESGVGSIPAVGSGVVPADDNAPRGIQAFNGFSGYYQLNTTESPLLVPGGSTRPLFFELGWLSGDPCPVNDLIFMDGTLFDALSPRAAMTVVVTNLDDPTQLGRTTMIAEVIDAGTFIGTNRYGAAAHAVGIEPAPDAETTLPVTPGQTVAFDVVALNKGNELDDLKITVSGADGWTHRLSVTDRLTGNDLCDLPTDGSTAVTCADVGVFDQVNVKVLVTPSAGVRIGDRDPITVTVISGDAPGIARTLALTARAAGVLDFAVGALGATTRSVPAGSTVSFPLFIANDGTADDTYGISIIRGDVGKWRAVTSTSSGLFVPAGHELAAFLTITAPTTAAVGDTDVFRVQIESKGNQARKTLEFSPIVAAPAALVVSGKEGQDILIPTRATDKTVNITSVQVSGADASPVVFTVDTASLPRGWSVDRTTATVPANDDASGRPTATAPFKVRAPADALGTSRGILRVTATAGGLSGSTDINLNLASTFGLNLTVEDADEVIAPGGAAVFNLTLRNLGLGEDVVRFTTTTLPSGWSMLFNPTSLTLGPLETQTVEAKLTAPVTANPGDLASLIAFAASETDNTQVASVPLLATVGFHRFEISLVSEALPEVAPQETATHVFNITNTGTLPDEILGEVKLDTAGQTGNVVHSGGPQRIQLNPGETVQATLVETYGANVPSGITVQTTVTYNSLLDARPAAQRATDSIAVTTKVLAYQFADVNGDSLRDYAVDRNGDAADGFEEFKASTTPGGRSIAAADLARFLRDDVRESLSRDVTLADGTTERVVVVPLDGDGDGKRDHFLDADGDGQPDYYWDPDANKASPVEFRKDVNGDQVPESFVDVDGDGRNDAVYDLTRAAFTKVVQIDVDGDGELDYVVDRDGDGTVDQDETVLYTRTGSLLIVQKVDVDGDGRLDQVFDTNGDGNPDYFVPDGSTESVPIVLRDVNSDGTMDWTFDGDGDGRRESYYDPATGEAHVIDAAGHFMDAMRKYWYIGALFAVVLVLFVALVLVTRK